jgi:hypothetical protein
LVDEARAPGRGCGGCHGAGARPAAVSGPADWQPMLGGHPSRAAQFGDGRRCEESEPQPRCPGGGAAEEGNAAAGDAAGARVAGAGGLRGGGEQAADPELPGPAPQPVTRPWPFLTDDTATALPGSSIWFLSRFCSFESFGNLLSTCSFTRSHCNF